MSQQAEALGLTASRRVLETIVSAHERSLFAPQDFTEIGGFTTAQAKRAYQIAVLDLLITHNVPIVLGSTDPTLLTKKTRHGVLELDPRIPVWVFPPKTNPQSFELYLQKGDFYLLRFHLHLGGSTQTFGHSTSYFNDYRKGRKSAEFVESDNTGLIRENQTLNTLEDMRMVWRGLRWATANLLEWDNKEFIKPEDLD